MSFDFDRTQLTIQNTEESKIDDSEMIEKQQNKDQKIKTLDY